MAMDPELKSRLDALIASMAERESREKAKESRETRERAARGENIRISGLEPAQFEAVEQQVKNVRDYLFQISGEKTKQLNLVSQEEDSFKRRVEYLKVHEQYAQKSVSAQRKLVEELSRDLALTRTRDSANAALISKKEDELRKAQENLSTSERQLNVEQRRLQAGQELLQIQTNITSHTQRLIGTITGGLIASNASQRSLLGALFGSGGGGQFGQKLKALGRGLLQTINPVNVLVGTFETLKNAIVNMAFQQDAAMTSLGKATGTGRNYATVINNVVEQNSRLGVTFEEGGRAAAMMFNSMRQFSQLTDSARQSITTFAIEQDRLGISLEQTGQKLNFLTQTFKMNNTEAQQVISNLNAFARQIGVSLQEASSNFVQFSGHLASHGPRMIQVFQNLQAMAKRTGVAMSELVNVAKQFDQFGTAASSVGRLNALLGGNYLNVIEMVSAKEDERLGIMARAVHQSNLNIDSMGRYTQKALAASMGFKDAGTAMAYLRNEMGMATAADRELIATMERDRREAEQLMDIKRQLRTILISVSRAFMPLIQSFSDHREEIVQTITKVVDFVRENGDLIRSFALYTPVVMGSISILKGLASAFTIARTAASAFTGALVLGGGLVAAVYSLREAFTKRSSPNTLEMPRLLAANLNAASASAMAAGNSFNSAGAGARNLKLALIPGIDATQRVGGNLRLLASYADEASRTTANLGKSMSAINVSSLRGNVSALAKFRKEMTPTSSEVRRAQEQAQTTMQTAQAIRVVAETGNAQAAVSALQRTVQAKVGASVEQNVYNKMFVEDAFIDKLSNRLISSGLGRRDVHAHLNVGARRMADVVIADAASRPADRAIYETHSGA